MNSRQGTVDPVFRGRLRTCRACGCRLRKMCLACDLPQVVSEPILDVPRLVEAASHQRLDPLLRGRPPERSDARVPPGAELDIRRQAGVDEALGLSDRPFVELGDASRERPLQTHPDRRRATPD
jgi:hypothetical protein